MARPRNLLIILADQLRRDVLSVYGGPVACPSLARLADRGLTATRAYCANPLCIPTRPSMMTGRYPHQHGATSFGAGFQEMQPGAELLCDRLHQAGYLVGYDGIWHVERAAGDAPLQDEFACFRPEGFCYRQFADQFVAAGGQDGDQRALVRTLTDTGEHHEWGFSLPLPAVLPASAGEHPDTARASRVATALRDLPADQPFAWWCSFGAPHPPLLVPEAYVGRHPVDASQPPASFGEPTAKQPRWVREAAGAQAVAGWTWDQWAPCHAAYLDYVAFLDDCVGLVLDGLAAGGHADDTLVLFLADHGEHLGSHNLYQKGTAYEESAGIPWLAAGPGVTREQTAELISQIDLAPTVLALLGLPPLEQATGTSLANLLAGGSGPGREALLVEFGGYIRGGIHWRCAVGADWKYVWYRNGEEQLFSRATDPAELHNLAGDPAHAAALAACRRHLGELMRASADPLLEEAPVGA